MKTEIQYLLEAIDQSEHPMREGPSALQVKKLWLREPNGQAWTLTLEPCHGLHDVLFVRGILRKSHR